MGPSFWSQDDDGEGSMPASEGVRKKRRPGGAPHYELQEKGSRLHSPCVKGLRAMSHHWGWLIARHLRFGVGIQKDFFVVAGSYGPLGGWLV